MITRKCEMTELEWAKQECGSKPGSTIYEWAEHSNILAGVGGAVGIELDTIDRGGRVDSLLKLEGSGQWS